MNPVNDSLNTIREALEHYLHDGAALAPGALKALETLETALSSNPPLTAVAERLCTEVDEADRCGRKQFGTIYLRRYTRDFRAAMEKKP